MNPSTARRWAPDREAPFLEILYEPGAPVRVGPEWRRGMVPTGATRPLAQGARGGRAHGLRDNKHRESHLGHFSPTDRGRPCPPDSPGSGAGRADDLRA